MLNSECWLPNPESWKSYQWSASLSPGRNGQLTQGTTNSGSHEVARATRPNSLSVRRQPWQAVLGHVQCRAPGERVQACPGTPIVHLRSREHGSHTGGAIGTRKHPGVNSGQPQLVRAARERQRERLSRPNSQAARDFHGTPLLRLLLMIALPADGAAMRASRM